MTLSPQNQCLTNVPPCSLIPYYVIIRSVFHKHSQTETKSIYMVYCLHTKFNLTLAVLKYRYNKTYSNHFIFN